MSYIDFLKSKMVIAPETGFDIDVSEINPALLPHQRAAVKWAVKGGCHYPIEVGELRP